MDGSKKLEEMEVDSSFPSEKGGKDQSPNPKTGKENLSRSSFVEKGTTSTYELEASVPCTSTVESTVTTGKFKTLKKFISS